MEPTRGPRQNSRHNRPHISRAQQGANDERANDESFNTPFDAELLDGVINATPRALEEWERRAQRRQARRKRRRRGGDGTTPDSRRFKWGRVMAFLLLILLGGASGWALTAPEMQVSGVESSDLKITNEAQIEPVEQQLRGQNWLRADLNSAELQLRRVPTIEKAQVTRSWRQWPPRLQMKIDERAPWFRIGGGATWWIVDEHGVAFRRAEDSDESLIALSATTLDISKLRAGYKLEPSIWEGARRLITALDAQAEKGEQWQLRRVYLDKNGLAALRLQGGEHDEMLIRLGSDRWAQKLVRAREALAFFDKIGRRALALNLVSYSRPTWTPQPDQVPKNDASNDASSAASNDADNAPTSADTPT